VNQAASAPVARRTGAAVPAALSFHDRFTGTIDQRGDQSAVILDINVAGTGERPVQLIIHLSGTRDAGGRVHVSDNQATLTDGAGVELCLGQVTALDSSGFLVQCDGVGSYAGTIFQVSGTITASTASRLQGDLDVSPSPG
jgi:hypothetical protein